MSICGLIPLNTLRFKCAILFFKFKIALQVEYQLEENAQQLR